MKRFFASLLLTLTAATSLLVAPVAAVDVFQHLDCSGKASTSAVCQDKTKPKNPLTGKNGVIMKIANIITIVAGAAAVIIIIVAGLKFITSGGEAAEVAGARKAILYTVIGLIVIISARFLVGLIVSRL